MKIEKLNQLYEGKAKKVYETDDPELLIVDYKDDATAFNGLKKGTIVGKGAINNQRDQLPDEAAGEERRSHPLGRGALRPRDGGQEACTIVPLEVIVRNIAAGSLSKRLGLPEGTKLKQHRAGVLLQGRRAGRSRWSTTTTSAPWGCATKEELATDSPTMRSRVNEMPCRLSEGRSTSS